MLPMKFPFTIAVPFRFRSSTLLRVRNTPLDHCQPQNLCQVQSVPIAQLLDLFVATETVRYDKRLFVRLANGWQQNSLTAFHRHSIVFPFLKTKCPSHAATA